MAQSVAFQGEHGAYSELGALQFFNNKKIKSVPCHSFDDVFTQVSRGESRFGFVPIENSLAGSIHRNYDLLLRHELKILGEYHLRVSHCLLALPGVRLEEIRKVHSHPQALAQCEASLTRLGLQSIVDIDTAGSARWLRDYPDRQSAALASSHAARVYGLQILLENMEDDSANYTRFIVLGKENTRRPDNASTAFKTSIVLSLNNQPGILFKALSVFALRDIDLTKIESRPMPGHVWEYMFYIDFAGQASDPICQRALQHLQELTTTLRILGSYPRHQIDYRSAP
jgi:arogenate/prephenate dehydratase